LTGVPAWFDEHSAGAPEPLRERAARYLAARDEPELAARLGAAAGAALRQVLAGRGDRDVALDLLAADALVTLALKARALEQPAALAEFAASLLSREARR